MSIVRLRFSPSPAHVRTVRLVAVACGRRAGVALDRLDELKLAVGEACGRAVARHRRVGITDLVLVEIIDGPGFEVRVHDYAPDVADPDDAEATVVTEAGIALLADSADIVKVTPGMGDIGSEVSLWWPTR